MTIGHITKKLHYTMGMLYVCNGFSLPSPVICMILTKLIGAGEIPAGLLNFSAGPAVGVDSHAPSN